MKRRTSLQASPSFVAVTGLVLAAMLLVLAPPQPAYGSNLTLTVDSVGDGGDAIPGDAVCATAGGACTLRAAIQEANADPGSDLIRFDIVGGCATSCTISPGSPLPAITYGVFIDGYSQAGAVFRDPDVAQDALLKIELSGTSAGPASGLTLESGVITVRGLAIGGFTGTAANGNGIHVVASGANVWGNFLGTDATGTIDRGNAQYGVRISGAQYVSVGNGEPANGNVISGNTYGVGILGTGAQNNTVLGNYIGTDTTGTHDLGNSSLGLYVDSGSGNFIGGTLPEDRNVISGNDNQGVQINFGSDNWVQGNYIGTDVTGFAALANAGGIYLYRTLNDLIGGTDAGAGNLISGNSGGGIVVDGGTAANGNAPATGNTIQGNRIGTDASGTSPLPGAVSLAQGGGITFTFNAHDNLVGGLAPGAANTIAFHRFEGVAVNGANAIGNAIRGNSIHDNGRLGIGGLGIESVNGGNANLAPPAITGESPVTGTSCPYCHIDVFSDDTTEGRVFHGSVDADAVGNWAFLGLVTGPAITATATDPANNTSNFSTPLFVVVVCPPGTWSTSGRPPCTPAPAGSFATGPGATSSTLCALGSFSAAAGASACTPAPADTYVPVAGATGVTPCAAGTSTGGVTGQAACLTVDSATGAGSVSFATNDGSLQSPVAIAEAILPTAGKPIGISFPFGFYAWTVTDLGQGDTITLTLTYPAPVPAGSAYWKVIGGNWVDASSALGSNDGDNVITLTLTDGGPFDADGTPNASITDPGGLGVVEVAPQYTLMVVLTGSGSGSVTSSPAGISCGADCTESFTAGTVVSLIPAISGPLAADTTFAGFSGDADCADGSVTLTADISCTATFNITTRRVASATGLGEVVFSTSAGSLDFLAAVPEAALTAPGKPASVTYPFGFFVWTVTQVPVGQSITVTMTYPSSVATGSSYWKLIGSTWTDATSLLGSNDGDNLLTLTITDGGLGDADGSANGSISDPGGPGSIVTPLQVRLTVSRAGTGSGSVTANPPPGCRVDGSDCTRYDQGTVVILTAMAAPGSSFAGFGGDADCADGTVTMNADHTCTATFNLVPQRKLSILLRGTGSGSVIKNPPGNNCSVDGTDCTRYDQGTVVTLAAIAAPGSTFAGFGGDADCADGTVTMNADRTCRATFNLIPQRELSVLVKGNGSGGVTRNPTGINCGIDGTDCTRYDQGTVVTLTAVAAYGSKFVGFTGNADCTDGSLTMTADRNCTATFNLVPTRNLTIKRTGSGSGSVSRNPAGINCSLDGSVDCARYVEGTVVVLTAVAAPDSTFSGWTGDCTGGVVTMTRNRTCTAEFKLVPQRSLLVKLVGTGSGTVTRAPAGLGCGPGNDPNCTIYVQGTVVTLTPVATYGSTFIDFGGDADCRDGSVTMSVSRTCTAEFKLVPQRKLLLKLVGNGTGSATVDPVGMNCTTSEVSCNSYVQGAVVTLTAIATYGSTFAGFGGDADCSDGSVTMSVNRSCTATFALLPTRTLTIKPGGNGTGTVTRDPVGLTCPLDSDFTCARYVVGEVVGLTALAAPGSTFAGWTGDCTGGVVTMRANRTCTAVFTRP